MYPVSLSAHSCPCPVTRPFRPHPSDRPGTQGDALGLRITAPWAVLTPTFARFTNTLDYGGNSLSCLGNAHDWDELCRKAGPKV